MKFLGHIHNIDFFAKELQRILKDDGVGWFLTPDEWKGEKYEPQLNKKICIEKVSTPSRSNLKIAARRCHDNMREKGIELGNWY